MALAPQQIPDGTKGRAKDGTPVVRQGGRWVAVGSGQAAPVARPKPRPDYGEGAYELPNGSIVRQGKSGAIQTLQAPPKDVSGEMGMRVSMGIPVSVEAQTRMDALEAGGKNPYGTWQGVVANTLLGQEDKGGIFDMMAKNIGGQDYQDYLQASSSFESSLLPIYSGAAVTDQEAQRFVRANLPRAGDSPKTLATKARNRKLILNSAAERVGEPRPFPNEPDWRPSAQPTQPKRKSAVKGQVTNGYRFKGGDPAKRENWERVK